MKLTDILLIIALAIVALVLWEIIDPGEIASYFMGAISASLNP